MPGVPGRLRFADLNSDGYPDTVLTLQYSNNSTNKVVTVTGVWMNADGNATEAYSARELIGGGAPTAYYTKIGSEAGSTGELVTFLDLDEDGRLDIIIQKTDENGLPSLDVLYNNIVTDNFFVKALLVNSKQEKNDNVFGNSAVGATYRFVVTDMKDHKLVRVGS